MLRAVAIYEQKTKKNPDLLEIDALKNYHLERCGFLAQVFSRDDLNKKNESHEDTITFCSQDAKFYFSR